MRGEELILLSHAAPGQVALLGLVDKVEREKELDGTRKLIGYVTICIQGGIPTRISDSGLQFVKSWLWRACNREHTGWHMQVHGLC